MGFTKGATGRDEYARSSGSIFTRARFVFFLSRVSCPCDVGFIGFYIIIVATRCLALFNKL